MLGAVRCRWLIVVYVWVVLAPGSWAEEATVAVQTKVYPSPQAPVPPDAYNELGFVLLEPGDSKTEQGILALEIRRAHEENSGPLEIFCQSSESHGPESCEGVRKLVEVTPPPRTTLETFKRPPRSQTGGAIPNLSYKTTYAVIRAILNGGAVATTVMITKGASVEQAVFEGALAAGWTAGMQYYNKEYLAWLASKGWLSLDPQIAGSPLQAFAKKAMSSTIYALLMHGGLSVTGLAEEVFSTQVARTLAKSVAQSLFTQTSWQRLNQVWTQRAIASNPAGEYRYRKNSAQASLVQSVVNVVGNALNLTGSSAGDWISSIVGTAGLAAHAIDHVMNRRPASQQAPSTFCEGSLQALVRN